MQKSFILPHSYVLSLTKIYFRYLKKHTAFYHWWKKSSNLVLQEKKICYWAFTAFNVRSNFQPLLHYQLQWLRLWQRKVNSGKSEKAADSLDSLDWSKMFGAVRHSGTRGADFKEIMEVKHLGTYWTGWGCIVWISGLRHLRGFCWDLLI